MRFSERARWLAAVGAALVLATSGSAQTPCVGDCSADHAVTVDEIVTGIAIALGNADIATCPRFDGNDDGLVTVEEIVTSVNHALNGCPAECDEDCDDHDACTNDACDDGACVHPPLTCEDDGEECTAEFCDPLTGCGRTDVSDGTPCALGAGECADGVCVPFPCVDAGECEDANPCTINSCIDHACVSAPVVCPDDDNDCTAEVCEPASGCVGHAVEDGTACDDGTGTCRAGICESSHVIQYQQNFEALDVDSSTALSSDHWVVFGNVYDGTGKYLYGYGTYPAPNGGEAFSALVTGQGGAEQGEHQLSVYNDYNNQDHAKGYRIEANFYRERRITSADVGTTITFSFDAKRGNINDPANPLCPCSSAAKGFIKTLNPAAGYATTNLVVEDTSALPTSWGRFSLTLAIDAGLVNQLLQVGFSSSATRFEPSAVFYDNLEVGSAPTTP